MFCVTSVSKLNNSSIKGLKIEARSQFLKNFSESDEKQIIYDRETNHSENEEEQAKWDKYIDEQLKELEAYKDTVVVVKLTK
jgi:hypothetical protein